VLNRRSLKLVWIALWPDRCGKFLLLCARNDVLIFKTTLHLVVLTLRIVLVELRCGQHADGSSVTKPRGQTVWDWTCVIKTNKMYIFS